MISSLVPFVAFSLSCAILFYIRNSPRSKNLYAYWSDHADKLGYGGFYVKMLDGKTEKAHFLGWSPDPKLFPDRKCLGLIEKALLLKPFGPGWVPPIISYGYYSKQAANRVTTNIYRGLNGEEIEITCVSFDPDFVHNRECRWPDTKFVGLTKEWIRRGDGPLEHKGIRLAEYTTEDGLAAEYFMPDYSIWEVVTCSNKKTTSCS